MAIDTSLNDKNNTTTGVVFVAFSNPIIQPVDVQVEWTNDVSGSPNSGSWAILGTIQNCSPAGDAIVDYRPLDGKTIWYRSAEVADGYLMSDYEAETSASAAVIPDMDFSKRPWNSQGTLQLDMYVTSSAPTTFTIATGVNDAVGGGVSGQPTVVVVSYSNITSIVTGSASGTWVATRNSGSTQPSSVLFGSTLRGYRPGSDRVTMFADGVADVTLNSFLDINAYVLQEFTTASIVVASGSSVAGYPLNVSLSQVLNSSGTVHTPWNNTSNVGLWWVQRPTNGTPATAQFFATSSGTPLTDRDSVQIQQQDFTTDSFILVQTNVTGSTATRLEISGSVYNPFGYPIGYGVQGATSGITVTRTGFSSFSSTRPVTGVASFQLFATSSTPGIEPDYDSVSVPSEQSGSLPALKLSLKLVTMNSGSMLISSSYNDPLSTASGSYSASVQPANRFNVSVVGPGQYLVDRPPFGSNDGQIQIFISANGRIADSDFYQIPEQISGLVNLKVKIDPVSITPTTLIVSASCADPLNQFPVTLSQSFHPGTTGASFTGPVNGVYTITRPVAGVGNAVFRVFGTAFGRGPDFDDYTVPESPSSKRSAPIPIGIVQELIDVGGSYSLAFGLSGFISSSATGSQGLHRGTENIQSSSFSPDLTGSYTPSVIIRDLNGGKAVYIRPQANSGSVPPVTTYSVAFAPNVTGSYSATIKWDGDAWNFPAERITAGIVAKSASGSVGFKVTSAPLTSDTLYNYVNYNISDPNATINPATRLQARVRSGPVGLATINPNIAPASGSTSGLYQFQIALSRVPTQVEVFANMVDGSTQTVASVTLDSAFYPIINPLQVSYSGSTATIYGLVDDLTPTGSNLFWREYGPPTAFTTESINQYHQFSFPVQMSLTGSRDIQIQSMNINGAVPPTDYHIVVNQYKPSARPGVIEFVETKPLNAGVPPVVAWAYGAQFKLLEYASDTALKPIARHYTSSFTQQPATGGEPVVVTLDINGTLSNWRPSYNTSTDVFAIYANFGDAPDSFRYTIRASGSAYTTDFFGPDTPPQADVIRVPAESRLTTGNVSAYLSNNRVFDVADYGAALDGVTDDSRAFNQAAYQADQSTRTAYLEVPGLLNINAHVSMSRAVTLVGPGVNSDAGIVASSQKSLYIIGAAAAKHMIRDARFGRVNVVYGNTSGDYGRGCSMDNVLIEDCPAAAGVVYRHHSYITRLNKVHITSCLHGVYFDFATAVSDSGANMVISDSVIDVCTNALYVNGMTADGCQIYVTNTDLEHCTSAVLKAVSTGGAGEPMIFFNGVNLELNNGSIFDNDGMQVWLSNFVALSVTENQFITQASGRMWMSNGRLSWAPNKFIKMSGGHVFVDPGTIFSSARWFSEGVINTGHGGGFANAVQMATSGSTGGRVQLPGQTQMRSQINAALTTITNASAGPVTASTFWKLDGNNRTWQIVADCSVTTNNNFLRMDVTNGVSTVRNDLNFPLFNGTAYLTITYVAGYEFKVRGQYVETTSGKVSNVSSTTSDNSSATNYDRALVFTTETNGGTKATMAITIIEEVVSGQEIVGL